MKNVEFNQIINDINNQINDCKSALSIYIANNCNIDKISIGDANTMITNCRKCQSKMDVFISSDIYHIIGMGNMNAAQMSQFIKITKTLMTYRSRIKYFATMNTIQTHAKSSKAKYKLQSGIILNTNFREDI